MSTWCVIRPFQWDYMNLWGCWNFAQPKGTHLIALEISSIRCRCRRWNFKFSRTLAYSLFRCTNKFKLINKISDAGGQLVYRLILKTRQAGFEFIQLGFLSWIYVPWNCIKSNFVPLVLLLWLHIFDHTSKTYTHKR